MVDTTRIETLKQVFETIPISVVGSYPSTMPYKAIIDQIEEKVDVITDGQPYLAALNDPILPYYLTDDESTIFPGNFDTKPTIHGHTFLGLAKRLDSPASSNIENSLPYTQFKLMLDYIVKNEIEGVKGVKFILPSPLMLYNRIDDFPSYKNVRPSISLLQDISKYIILEYLNKIVTLVDDMELMERGILPIVQFDFPTVGHALGDYPIDFCIKDWELIEQNAEKLFGRLIFSAYILDGLDFDLLGNSKKRSQEKSKKEFIDKIVLNPKMKKVSSSREEPLVHILSFGDVITRQGRDPSMTRLDKWGITGELLTRTNRYLSLGVVSHKYSAIEPLPEIIKRIEIVSDLLNDEKRVIFTPTSGLRTLNTPENAKNKLALLRTARNKSKLFDND